MVKALTEIEIKKKINKMYCGDILLDNFIYNGMFRNAKYKCAICGNEWEDKVANVLNHRGCPHCKCENFINESKKKFGDMFDYSKCHETYKGQKQNVTIICKKHNKEFVVKPYYHLLNINGGCKDCENELKSLNKIKTLESFINKTKENFGDNFSFEKTNYKGQFEPTIVTCREHGDITIIPKYFFKTMYGCSKCATESRKISEENIIKRFRQVHGNKYNYGKYNGIEKEMDIYCPIHGLFRQTPHNHLAKEGCPQCVRNYKLENEIKNKLKQVDARFESQKKFEWSKRLSFDFYVPCAKILIECQGLQHFEPIEFFGGENALNSQKKRDKLKFNLSREHNMNLVYYCDKKFAKYYEGTDVTFFTDTESLIDYVKKNEET